MRDPKYENFSELSDFPKSDDSMLKTFIQRNHRKMHARALMMTFDVDMAYIQSVLTDRQYEKIGCDATPSILILHPPSEYGKPVRDISNYELSPAIKLPNDLKPSRYIDRSKIIGKYKDEVPIEAFLLHPITREEVKVRVGIECAQGSLSDLIVSLREPVRFIIKEANLTNLLGNSNEN
jgi:hypothetical protein